MLTTSQIKHSASEHSFVVVVLPQRKILTNGVSVYPSNSLVVDDDKNKPPGKCDTVWLRYHASIAPPLLN